MPQELSQKQAIELAKSDWWKGLPPDVVVAFQLFEDRLCMEFGDFHRGVEQALGREVWTHEFAFIGRLRKEFLELHPRVTLTEIMELIPPEKRVMVPNIVEAINLMAVSAPYLFAL